MHGSGAAGELYTGLYGKSIFAFDSSDERTFVINKFSDFFNEDKNIKGVTIRDAFINRSDELLDKYRNYVKSYKEIAIVHINSTHDTLYIAVDESHTDNFCSPHVRIPGGETKAGFLIIPLTNFINSLIL